MTPEISGAGRTSSQVYSSVSLNYSLLNGRLHLNAGIENIASPDPRTTMTTEGNTVEVVNMNMRNMLTASLTYTFGARLKGKRASKNAEAMRSRF